MLVRFDDDQYHDRSQKQYRNLINDTIENMAVTIAVMFETKVKLAEIEMVSHQQHHQRQLHVHPALVHVTRHIVTKQPAAKYQRKQHAGGGNAKKQFSFHDFEAINTGRVGRHGVVDKQSGQIKKTAEPGDHEDNME